VSGSKLNMTMSGNAASTINSGTFTSTTYYEGINVRFSFSFSYIYVAPMLCYSLYISSLLVCLHFKNKSDVCILKLQVDSKSGSFCDIVSCPVAAGAVSISTVSDVPADLPSGNYVVELKTTTAFCIKVTWSL
jgi:hypothetical protein